MSYKNNTSVAVLINGKPVKLYGKAGRNYVEAKNGSYYTLKLRNDRAMRVLAVVSVDGLNVLDGELCHSDSSGYIIPAYSSLEVKGFRTSDEEVRAFEFGRKEDSYAKKTDAEGSSEQNCGVIGVKMFSEKVKLPDLKDILQEPEPYHPWRPYPKPIYPRYADPIWQLHDSATYSSSADSMLGGSVKRCMSLCTNSSAEFEAGTVFSDKKIEDKVRTVEFERGDEVAFHEIFYAFRGNLEAMGVIQESKPAMVFPSSFHEQKYCKPPKR